MQFLLLIFAYKVHGIHQFNLVYIQTNLVFVQPFPLLLLIFLLLSLIILSWYLHHFVGFLDSVLFLCIRNVLLVNSSADHLKVGDFGLSKLIKVQNSHDVYKMTGETGSCEYLL